MLESLFNPSITSVLIKGEPGTGKTTLAVELLKRNGGGLYISTRVSREKLLEQQQRIKPVIEGKENHSERGIRHAYLFEDQRFGNASDIVGALTERIDSVDDKDDRVIALDSWDSIAKELDRIERFKVEKSLLLLAESRRAKLLFISEEPDLTTTDYLVDAIVALKDDSLSGRRIRRMEVKKLRGTAIPQRSYAYTLHENTFTLLDSSSIQWLPKETAKPFKPIPHNDEFLSTGSKDLDSFLGGGIRRGSAMLLELSQEIGSDGHYPFASTLRNNFISNDGSSVVILSGSITPEMACDSAKNFLPVRKVEAGFRLGSFEEYRRGPCFFKLNSFSLAKTFDLFWRQIELAKKRRKGPCLVFLAAERLESMFGAEDLPKWIIRSVQKVKRSGDLLVVTVRDSTRSKPELSDFSDFHLRLGAVDGAPILYSIKPASQLHSIKYDYRAGRLEIKMKPIV